MREFPKYEATRAKILAEARAALEASSVAVMQSPSSRSTLLLGPVRENNIVHADVCLQVVQATGKNRFVDLDEVHHVELRVPYGKVWPTSSRRYPVRADGTWAVGKAVVAATEALIWLAAEQIGSQALAVARKRYTDRLRDEIQILLESLAKDGYTAERRGMGTRFKRGGMLSEFIEVAPTDDTYSKSEFRISVSVFDAAECAALVLGARRALEEFRGGKQAP